MTIQHLAPVYLRKIKQIWRIRYENELKSIAVMNMSKAADGGEPKPKNIFNSQKNVEATIPLKKRLISYRYEDFQPVSEDKKEPTAAVKKNLRPRNSPSSSSDTEKPRFVPGPYEKPVTRRQTRKPATEVTLTPTPTPTPTPKVQTNGKRKRKSGKENQQNANNKRKKPNNCEPSTSIVEINSSIKPSVNEPIEQQQEHLTEQQQEQFEQKQNRLNTTATELKGEDLISLLEMVAKKESSEKAIVDMVKSDDEPIDYSMKPKEILIQKKPSPSTSNNKRTRKPKPSKPSKPSKVEPLKIRLVSPSIQGMPVHTKPLVL